MGTLYQVSKIMFDCVLNKVMLEHFKHLSQQLMPSCDLPTVLPVNFMTETLKINRSTSIALHDLIQIKPVRVSLSGPIPYELNAVKYTVKCESPISKSNTGFKNTIRRTHWYPDITINSTYNIKDLQLEFIESYLLPPCQSLQSEMKKWRHLNFKVDIPMIVNPSHKRLLIHPPPKWSLPDSIDLFDVSHDNLSSHIPKHSIPEREVLLIEDKSASSKYFCQHQFLFTPPQPCINRMRYHTWAYNDSSLATPCTEDITQYLLDQNRVTESGKYLVLPVACPNIKMKNSPATTISQFIFSHLKLEKHNWKLPSHVLIENMSWNPFKVDAANFVDKYLMEIITRKKSFMITIDKTIISSVQMVSLPKTTAIFPKISKIESSHELKPVNIRDSKRNNTPTKSDGLTNTQIQTNIATYHNDTDIMNELISSRKRKRKKLGTVSNVVLPPEISTLLFVEPKTPPQHKDTVEETQNCAELSISTNKSAFAATQHIIINETLWDTNNQLAKSLSDVVHIFEMKIKLPIDIIVNVTTGIYCTLSDYLLQSDGHCEFLILTTLLLLKKHFHSLFVFTTVSTPIFLKHSTEKIQKLQVLCMSLNIKLFLIPPHDLIVWILQVLRVEGPEKSTHFIDTNNPDGNFLSECGLSYFQVNQVLQRCSFNEFLVMDTKEKINQFGEIITSELIVCIIVTNI